MTQLRVQKNMKGKWQVCFKTKKGGWARIDRDTFGTRHAAEGKRDKILKEWPSFYIKEP